MLNLYEILTKVLNESVTSDNINDAIDNKYQVIINYSDEDNHAPNERIIEPYVYGISKAGNEVLRAFQYNGNSYRGTPKWKLFRLDRIKSWRPTNNHFNTSPSKNGWDAEEYNKNGDKLMKVIFNQINFDSNNNGTQTFSPNDTLNKLRQKTQSLKNSTPINIKDLTQNNRLKNSQTIQDVINPIDNTNDANFQKMLRKNLEITQKEKNKRHFSLSNNKTIADVMSNKDNNSNNEITQTINNKNDTEDFQKKLQNNIESE